MISETKTKLALSTAFAVAFLGISPLAAQTDREMMLLDAGVDPDTIGQDTDGDAQEVTLSELEELLNIPSPTVVGQEYQEDLENPFSLFEEEGAVERIFGEQPAFIYFPEGVDPMIIPWIRERIIAEELFQEAMSAARNRDFDRSIELLRQIQEEFPNTSEGQRVPSELARVIELRNQELAPEEHEDVEIARPDEQETMLPRWVTENTTGVMMGVTRRVIVGNDFLREGDPVPRYSSVRVKSITQSEVVYEYQNREFVVEVVGSF